MRALKELKVLKVIKDQLVIQAYQVYKDLLV